MRHLVFGVEASPSGKELVAWGGEEAVGRNRKLRFEDLPDSFLVKVLENCSGEDIARMQTVNCHLHYLGRICTVWRESIWKHHGILIPSQCAPSWTTLKGIHRELVEDPQHDVRLQFRGFLTDAGMQDNDSAFWVDNMFHSDISSSYSSGMMTSNGVRCIGLYRPKLKSSTRTGVKYAKLNVPLSMGQKFPGSTTQHRQLWTDHRLSTPQSRHNVTTTKNMVLVRRIQVCKSGGLFFRPVDRGVVLLGNESSVLADHGVHRTECLALGLYSQTMSSLVNTINGFVNLASVLVACQSGMINTPTRVGIEVGAEGVGEWVEFGEESGVTGAMRPVVWFRMYSRNECMGGWTRERQIQALTMRAKFTAMGVDFLIVHVEANTTKRASGMLNIPLLQPVIGDAVCALLSSSEPVIPDVIKIPDESNYVEVNYVWLLGKELKVNKAIE